MQFPDEHFDAVFSADVVEHISYEQKQLVLEEVYRVLKPGGTLVIKTQNLTYLRLSIGLRRVARLLQGRSPFIHVAHTKNNPDNEHFGLTTYGELERLLSAAFFHDPRMHHVPLVRDGIPRSVQKLLYGRTFFSEHIILAARKALFKSMFP